MSRDDLALVQRGSGSKVRPCVYVWLIHWPVIDWAIRKRPLSERTAFRDFCDAFRRGDLTATRDGLGNCCDEIDWYFHEKYGDLTDLAAVFDHGNRNLDMDEWRQIRQSDWARSRHEGTLANVQAYQAFMRPAVIHLLSLSLIAPLLQIVLSFHGPF